MEFFTQEDFDFYLYIRGTESIVKNSDLNRETGKKILSTILVKTQYWTKLLNLYTLFVYLLQHMSGYLNYVDQNAPKLV